MGMQMAERANVPNVICMKTLIYPWADSLSQSPCLCQAPLILTGSLANAEIHSDKHKHTKKETSVPSESCT